MRAWAGREQAGRECEQAGRDTERECGSGPSRTEHRAGMRGWIDGPSEWECEDRTTRNLSAEYEERSQSQHFPCSPL